MPSRPSRRSHYSVSFTPTAERELKKLAKKHKAAAHRITEAIASLEENPRPQGVKTLSGKEGILRLRVGDYRVVYAVRDRELRILVLALGHRRDVYRLL